MTDTTKIEFGKYKGKMIGQVPANYLLWFYENLRDKNSPWAKEFKEYVEDNMEVLKMEIENTRFY